MVDARALGGNFGSVLDLGVVRNKSFLGKTPALPSALGTELWDSHMETSVETGILFEPQVDILFGLKMHF